MKNILWLRVVVDIIIAFSVIFGWWQVALPLGLVAAWFSPYYVELILAGLFYDALFGLSMAAGLWDYAGTIISVIAIVAVYFAKHSVRRSSGV